MRMRTCALALSTILAAATPALAIGPGEQTGGPEPRAENIHPGPERRGPRHDPPGPHGPMPGMHWGGPLKLAEMLSALETAIGVRADQLDVWRDFTDAVQAVMQPPKQPAPKDRGDRPDVFNMAMTMATDMAEKGKKAEELKTAVEALRGSLSPEQLERARQARLLMPPRMGRGDHRSQQAYPGQANHGAHSPLASER